MNAAASRLERLDEIEAAVWRELGRAVKDPAHGWRVAVLATVVGDAADARSVVLRELDLAARWSTACRPRAVAASASTA